MFLGGNGGDGWSDCVPNEPVEAGGDGGAGGSTTGNEGAGGQGQAQGASGGTFFENVGNGGNGGNGEDPGAAGAKGAKGSVTGPTTVVDPVFQDGQPGNNCPVAEPVSVYLDQGSIPNSLGAVDPGSYLLNLVNALEEAVGSMTVATIGPAGNHFVGLNPARFGYFGSNGWDFRLDGITVGGQPFGVEEFEVCFYFTELDSENPALIEQLNESGEVIDTEVVTSLATPPPAGAQKTGEGGLNCRSRQVLIEARIVRVSGPDNRWVDIGGPSGRPGARLWGRTPN